MHPPLRGQVVAHLGGRERDGGVEVLRVDGDPLRDDLGRGQVTENEYVANGISLGATPKGLLQSTYFFYSPQGPS